MFATRCVPLTRIKFRACVDDLLPTALKAAHELLLRFSQRSPFSSREVQVLLDLHRVDIAATAAASNLDPSAPGQGPSVSSASRTDKRNFSFLHLKILLCDESEPTEFCSGTGCKSVNPLA